MAGGTPVVFDATLRSSSRAGGGDDRRPAEFVPVLARAAVSIGGGGVHGTHQDPDNAPSDGLVRLEDMPDLLQTLKAFDKVAKDVPSRSDRRRPSTGGRAGQTVLELSPRPV